MSTINWIEIPVLDLNRAQNFYKNVLSITSTINNIGNEKHAILEMNGQVGGILIESETINPGISIFFNVDRMNDILSKVESNKGTILQPKTLLKSYNSDNISTIGATLFDGKIGYFSKIKDSEGNIIGLHSNS